MYRNQPAQITILIQWFLRSWLVGLPATHAVRKQAAEPAQRALTDMLARSDFRSGHRAPSAPSVIPRDPRFEKPHSAYVAIITDRSCGLGKCSMVRYKWKEHCAERRSSAVLNEDWEEERVGGYASYACSNAHGTRNQVRETKRYVRFRRQR